MADLIIPQFDTPATQDVSISLDVGIIPTGYPGAGKFIVTIQAHPFAKQKDAQVIADALRDAINSRLGIRMEKQEGRVVDARGH